MLEKITLREGWNEGVLAAGGNFLQSWEWGEFQKAAGFDVLRLGESSTASFGQFIRRPLPFGHFYWYCPRGPLGDLDAFFGHIDTSMYRSVGPEFGGAMFVRLEPPVAKVYPVAKAMGDKPGGESIGVSVTPVQPAQTLILDLKKEPEELLAAMHEKTRYNIRLAEKKGVRVYAASGREDSFEIFWDLLQETTTRDAFHAHDKSYYRTMLDTLSGDPESDGKNRPVARLAFAEHDGKVLAANLMIYFGGTATYLHGASSRVQREVMAPYLLHWHLIRESRSWGCYAYDFWGVAPENRPEHPWAGITRFKRGFGGTYVEYPGAFDLPLKRFWYTLYSLARRARP